MNDIIKYLCAKQTVIIGLKIARVIIHAEITGIKDLFGRIQRSTVAHVRI